MESVCDSIYASLEGTKNWTAHWHQNRVEREAYVSAFSRCQELARWHHLSPDAMLFALDKYHDQILAQKKPPLFSLARWFYDTVGAEEQAVRVAFDIIRNIKRRFCD